MDLSMPDKVNRTEPGSIYTPQTYVFDHWPSLRELLPKWRGRPGFIYFQCAVVNLRRAQDEGWVEVDNTVIYTIEGPRGTVDVKLLCRGKLTPGQPHNSGERLCYADITAQELIGVWINPNQHPKGSLPGTKSSDSPEEAQEPAPTQTSVKPNLPEAAPVFQSGGGPDAA